MPEKKILVVDDEVEIVDLVSSSLSGMFDVTGVSDPNEAMAAFNADQFELVILDINLGSISGYDLCEEMQSESQQT